MSSQQASDLSGSVFPALGLQVCAITLMGYALPSMGYHMGSVYRPQALIVKQQALYLLNHMPSHEY